MITHRRRKVDVKLVCETDDDEIFKGYAIIKGGCTIGLIYEDASFGWRPWSIFGYCFTLGQKPYRTIKQAINFFFEDTDEVFNLTEIIEKEEQK